MNIKGTGVKSVDEFVKNKFSDNYQEWLSLLPEASKIIYTNPIYVTNWYSIQDAIVTPVQLISSLFYDNNVEKAAIESGRHSAEMALNGIYKIFIKVASPNFIINRTSIIAASYFSSCEIIVIESFTKSARFQIIKFPGIDKIVELRIKGWVEKALEMTGAKKVNININKSLTRNDECSEFSVSWE